MVFFERTSTLAIVVFTKHMHFFWEMESQLGGVGYYRLRLLDPEIYTGGVTRLSLTPLYDQL